MVLNERGERAAAGGRTEAVDALVAEQLANLVHVARNRVGVVLADVVALFGQLAIARFHRRGDNPQPVHRLQRGGDRRGMDDVVVGRYRRIIRALQRRFGVDEAAVVHGHQGAVSDVLEQLLQVLAVDQRGVARAAGKEIDRGRVVCLRVRCVRRRVGLRLDDGYRHGHGATVGCLPILGSVKGVAGGAQLAEGLGRTFGALQAGQVATRLGQGRGREQKHQRQCAQLPGTRILSSHDATLCRYRCCAQGWLVSLVKLAAAKGASTCRKLLVTDGNKCRQSSFAACVVDSYFLKARHCKAGSSAAAAVQHADERR
jgi:hypothetical protein